MVHDLNAFAEGKKRMRCKCSQRSQQSRLSVECSMTFDKHLKDMVFQSCCSLLQTADTVLLQCRV